MNIHLTRITLPGPKQVFENPLPRFRSARKDTPVETNGSLLPEESGETLGRDTGARVLPYRMQDVYDRGREPLERDAIVMENDRLKAVFLPWLGGKLYSLTEKSTGRPILFTNPVFQPANLAIRDAWTSGGVEWNIGQLGHTFTTCSDVFFEKIAPANEAPFLRMFEFERQKRLFWSIDFHLPDGAEALTAHVRIVNDDDFAKPLYWWTNTAVVEEEGARVFSATDEVIYQDWEPDYSDPKGARWRYRGFGHAKVPYYTDRENKNHSEKDVTYSLNIPRASEYFFQTSAREPFPWEAVGYRDGFMFFEKSTQPLRFRKMFCWGSGRGGRFWCDYLSEPGKGDYIELQAGLAPTQLHGAEIAAKSEIRFTQSFSRARVSRPDEFSGDWKAARDAAKRAVCGVVSDEDMAGIDARARALSLAGGERQLLHIGSGWGALEARRRALVGLSMPSGFDFPPESMGGEEKIWLRLLEDGTLADAVPASFMVDERWQAYLEADDSDAARLHLGILRMEAGDADGAEALWTRIRDERLAPMALRNLSQARLRRGDGAGAIRYMALSLQAGGDRADAAYTREYIQLLLDDMRFGEAWRAYQSAPEIARADDRVKILAAQAAIETGEYDYLDEFFQTPHVAVREGETSLTDLWFRLEAIREAKSRGTDVTDELIQEIRATRNPPRAIDFRMN